jgi:hypothetical protein
MVAVVRARLVSVSDAGLRQRGASAILAITCRCSALDMAGSLERQRPVSMRRHRAPANTAVPEHRCRCIGLPDPARVDVARLAMETKSFTGSARLPLSIRGLLPASPGYRLRRVV